MTALPPDSPLPEGLALLSLTQWLSPAFPTGAFAYSHGLEWAVAQGEVRDAATAGDWVADVLECGAGWTDAVLLAQALDPDADHATLADHARALAGSRERLAETEALGAAFARGMRALGGAVRPDWPFPIALGAAAHPLGLPAGTVIALALQSFATNLVTIATRIVPLGQSAGQAALAGLHPLILRLAKAAAVADLSDLRTSAFRAEMAAAWHENLQPRLFLS
jgi:urease accessory protein